MGGYEIFGDAQGVLEGGSALNRVPAKGSGDAGAGAGLWAQMCLMLSGKT